MSWFGRGPKTGVSASAALDLLKGNAVLVDVRDAKEWRAGHAPLATHIPLDRLATSLNRLRRDRSVIVVCRSGTRASRAVADLRKAGFEAVNVRGGMGAWEQAGGSVVRDGGQPGRVI